MMPLGAQSRPAVQLTLVSAELAEGDALRVSVKAEGLSGQRVVLAEGATLLAGGELNLRGEAELVVRNLAPGRRRIMARLPQRMDLPSEVVWVQVTGEELPPATATDFRMAASGEQGRRRVQVVEGRLEVNQQRLEIDGALAAAAVDADLDGRMDLMVATREELLLLVARLDGTYDPAVKLARWPESISAITNLLPGDWNGDGRWDVLLGTDTGVELWVAGRDGGLERRFRETAYRQPVEADVNGDGVPDVLVERTAADGKTEPWVWMGTGAWGFVPVKRQPPEGREADAAQVSVQGPVEKAAGVAGGEPQRSVGGGSTTNRLTPVPVTDQIATMFSPAPGTTLAGSTVTFTWSAETGATAYWLDVGPSPGWGVYFGKNVGLATSQTVTGIPADGSMVAIRLWTLIGGVWQYNDYSYTAIKAGVITSPAPGTTLPGSMVTFAWSAGTGATAYWLDVGPSPGWGIYFAKNVGLVTGYTVTRTPADGSLVAVRLWTLIDGVWLYNDYSYTAIKAGVITSPAPGTVLAGSTVTFTWSAGTGATTYWLDIGPSPGWGIYFGKNVGLVTSQTVTGIPTDGSLVAVRLWTLIGGVWQYNDYTYTAAGRAVMSTPAPGTTLAGSTVTFTWSAGTGATAYWLDVGPSPGWGIYFGQNVGLATSQTVTGIPADGSIVAVRLWTLIGGVWQHNDYSYTAASVGTKAVMSTPAPGTTLAGSTVTFTWSAGTGATAYWLDVGPSPGWGIYFGQNVGLATSQTVTGIPADGSLVAVRLWTLIGGVWYYNDYSYTAFH